MDSVFCGHSLIPDPAPPRWKCSACDARITVTGWGMGVDATEPFQCPRSETVATRGKPDAPGVNTCPEALAKSSSVSASPREEIGRLVTAFGAWMQAYGGEPQGTDFERRAEAKSEEFRAALLAAVERLARHADVMEQAKADLMLANRVIQDRMLAAESRERGRIGALADEVETEAEECDDCCYVRLRAVAAALRALAPQKEAQTSEAYTDRQPAPTGSGGSCDGNRTEDL